MLLSKRLGTGKARTACIERGNSNVRHHLSLFTRRTKIVSKSEKMADYTLNVACCDDQGTIQKTTKKIAIYIWRNNLFVFYRQCHNFTVIPQPIVLKEESTYSTSAAVENNGQWTFYDYNAAKLICILGIGLTMPFFCHRIVDCPLL